MRKWFVAFILAAVLCIVLAAVISVGYGLITGNQYSKIPAILAFMAPMFALLALLCMPKQP